MSDKVLPKKIIEIFKNLEGLILDCDGVLTPGDLYFSKNGAELLRFHSLDGFGLAMLIKSGVKVAVLSGRSTTIAEARLREIGVEHFSGSSLHKRSGFLELCEKMNLNPKHVAYMGDDLPDLGAFAVAAVAISVPNGHEEAQKRADVVTNESGGRGAVREVCDAIVKAKGLWNQWLERVTQEQLQTK